MIIDFRAFSAFQDFMTTFPDLPGFSELFCISLGLRNLLFDILARTLGTPRDCPIFWGLFETFLVHFGIFSADFGSFRELSTPNAHLNINCSFYESLISYQATITRFFDLKKKEPTTKNQSV